MEQEKPHIAVVFKVPHVSNQKIINIINIKNDRGDAKVSDDS